MLLLTFHLQHFLKFFQCSCNYWFSITPPTPEQSLAMFLVFSYKLITLSGFVSSFLVAPVGQELSFHYCPFFPSSGFSPFKGASFTLQVGGNLPEQTYPWILPSEVETYDNQSQVRVAKMQRFWIFLL